MRLRKVVFFLCLVQALASLPLVSASHGTTIGTGFCKWNFPWTTGQPVKHWINSNMAWPQFPGGHSDAASRIVWGTGTWNDWGFNLQFSRAQSTSEATNGYGRVSQNLVATPSSSTSVADVFIYPNSGCNRDLGNPIQQAVTSWNPNYRFHNDCRSVGSTWCVNNGYYDIHNVAAHEFGHWFHLGHSGDNGHSTNTDATMYGFIPLGEWKKRDLTSDDIYAGTLMYGRH